MAEAQRGKLARRDGRSEGNKNPMSIQVYNHTLPEDCQVGNGKAEVVVTNADGGKFFYCFYHWAPMMMAFLLEKTKGFDRDEEVVATVGEIHLYL